MTDKESVEGASRIRQWIDQILFWGGTVTSVGIVLLLGAEAISLNWYKLVEGKDAPYFTTDTSVVEKMLEVGGVTDSDVVYDLGSGDGRIPIKAATKYGARGVGIEIDSALVDTSREVAKKAGVQNRTEFRQKDLLEAELNLSDATVVTLYLFEEINVKLRPTLLRQLDPGDKIVSHDFGMGRWEPDTLIDGGPDKTGRAQIMRWTVPENPPDSLFRIKDKWID